MLYEGIWCQYLQLYYVPDTRYTREYMTNFDNSTLIIRPFGWTIVQLLYKCGARKKHRRSWELHACMHDLVVEHLIRALPGILNIHDKRIGRRQPTTRCNNKENNVFNWNELYFNNSRVYNMMIKLSYMLSELQYTFKVIST